MPKRPKGMPRAQWAARNQQNKAPRNTPRNNGRTPGQSTLLLLSIAWNWHLANIIRQMGGVPVGVSAAIPGAASAKDLQGILKMMSFSYLGSVDPEVPDSVGSLVSPILKMAGFPAEYWAEAMGVDGWTRQSVQTHAFDSLVDQMKGSPMMGGASKLVSKLADTITDAGKERIMNAIQGSPAGKAMELMGVLPGSPTDTLRW